MKNYLVGINFADSIKAESEEEAIEIFNAMYGIGKLWLFVEEQKSKEEVAILTPDRVVAEMAEDARAGDVYEGEAK